MGNYLWHLKGAKIVYFNGKGYAMMVPIDK
jgi:hypothetical protein